ncbi:MAG: tRNA (adenosine(37)-N6)-threonylcarbamoyltransferase complex ATPase subunit type 1 TsaE [Candidatus Pelagibacter sp.]|nr:tRNA (adenosine(37)-N6)-threonylcarbamoyltransferase complex ATPase subunit type 1 TsaE [Candidatus Pelagibacter sp.]|tara:strand:+ start:3016 stop:3498 length:483 start_codon:yes stop_codon:yes gene_type:complete
MPIATNCSKFDISEEKKTKLIAKIFSENLNKGWNLFLYGEIGVGKSTFVKFLINSLQKKYNQSITEVPSPTFNLINEYEINSIIIQHLDLYRLKNQKELNNLEILENTLDYIKIIEWPELLENFNLSNKINFNFEYGENMEKRYLTISTNMSLKFLNEIK